MSPRSASVRCVTTTSMKFIPSGLCFSPDYFDSKDDFLFLNGVFHKFWDDIVVFPRLHFMDFNK